MIVCVCRNIRETDFHSLEELRERVLCCDYECGVCLEDYMDNETKENNKEIFQGDL